MMKTMAKNVTDIIVDYYLFALLNKYFAFLFFIPPEIDSERSGDKLLWNQS